MKHLFARKSIAQLHSEAEGENRLRRLDAAWEQLPNAVQCEVQAGDELEIRTPGGGGWGPLP